MAKLEHMGARKDIVGIVVPSGYSFNLDGNFHLSLSERGNGGILPIREKFFH